MDRMETARVFIDRYRHLQVGRSDPGWQESQADIARFVSAGDYEQLTALLDLLEEAPDNPFHLAKQQARNSLALIPHPAAVEAYLLLSSNPPPTWRGPRERHDWQRAALLGYGQELEGLDRALRDHLGDEALRPLLACWAQECLLRGDDVGKLDRARSLWSGLEAEGHPLAWLPLELAPLERGLMLRAHRGDWLGNWFPFAHGPYPTSLTSVAKAAAAVDATLIDLDETSRREILGFADDAYLFPNATFECSAFDRQGELQSNTRPALPSLPLECLAEANEIRQTPITARETINLLFVMATQGGAYSVGRSAAWGRLRAWQCAGALAGARAAEGFGALVTAVENASWTFFNADSPWWNRVCIDFGLACAGRSSAGLRVIALTDSD